MLAFLLVLGAPRRRRLRLALAEHGLRFFQLGLDFCCDWMRTAENAPRGLFRVLKRRHGLTEIVDCGAVVEDVLASGLSRVAVEPAPKRRRRREPAVRFTAPLSERHAVQGQYDEQNRRP
jgi:hypothetical protein